MFIAWPSAPILESPECMPRTMLRVSAAVFASTDEFLDRIQIPCALVSAAMIWFKSWPSVKAFGLPLLCRARKHSSIVAVRNSCFMKEEARHRII